MAFSIGPRTQVDSFRMRSVPERYRGDFVTSHTREINGKLFDFSRTRWADGDVTVRVTPHRRTDVVHVWHGRAPRR